MFNYQFIHATRRVREDASSFATKRAILTHVHANRAMLYNQGMQTNVFLVSKPCYLQKIVVHKIVGVT